MLRHTTIPPIHRIAGLSLVVIAIATSCSSTRASSSSATSVRSSSSAALVAPEAVPANPSAGCSAAVPVPAGESQVDLPEGSDARFYLRHVPPAHNGTTPIALIMDFHGYSEGAAIHEHMSALGPFGDEHDFVTITPQGQGVIPRWDFTIDSTDLAFIRHVLDNAEATLCIDENRVFVTGLSNGAFMTSVIACAMANRFAAASPVAGIRSVEGCDPSRSVPVIAFHGTADPFVAFDGSMGPAAAKLPAPDGSGRTLGEIGAVDPTAKGPTIPEITASWAQRNQCDESPSETVVASDVTLVQFTCPPGAEVELYRITDGGHTWPGSEVSKKIESIVGHTTDSISANELMWTFFLAHPLQPATSAN